ERLKASLNVQKPLVAPLAKGQAVGPVTVELDGRKVLETPLVALEEYLEGGFFKRLGDSIMLWFE
ncbi:MAG TPA: serine-type D-Ala-D-Ala carboxypeptidase, partial [Xanthomonadales bacterium]|nr:serine-type D-Ala-D-Ala carboxypeptidase [Xanthomonadales bacterium]